MEDDITGEIFTEKIVGHGNRVYLVCKGYLRVDREGNELPDTELNEGIFHLNSDQLIKIANEMKRDGDEGGVN